MDEELNSSQPEGENKGEHGYMLHFSFGDHAYPNSTNYHSHGILESFNHPDFQLCLPLEKSVAEGIFDNLIFLVEGGQKFEEGKDYPDILRHGYLLRFVKAQQGGREVLRILIPDEDGSFAIGPYLAQLTKLSDQ